MRTITEKQWQALEDLSAEGLLEGLPPQTAEKDIHVTDLLAALSRIEIRHGHFKGLEPNDTEIDDGIRLIFAGGTCLSKAHGLTARMSEDVDIKVILEPPSRELKAHVGPRARLKALHDHVKPTLKSLGFSIPSQLNGGPNPRIRDEHRYCVIGAAYNPKGPRILSLRPELKLEILHRHPRLETPHLPFGYLHERIAKLTPSVSITMPCISVAETLAEKVLSLLRRCAADWSKGPENALTDKEIARHIYDVHQIVRSKPEAIESAALIFRDAVQHDANHYRRQHPAFKADPLGCLREALAQAKVNGTLRAQYEQKVLPLVYGSARTPYDAAFDEFERAANHLLGTLA
jgi:hypothetical protein